MTETQKDVGKRGTCATPSSNLLPGWPSTTSVTVRRVEIFNRDGFGDRTGNVDVRVSNELPSTGALMFSGGSLLGHFSGPAADGQKITISG